MVTHKAVSSLTKILYYKNFLQKYVVFYYLHKLFTKS